MRQGCVGPNAGILGFLTIPVLVTSRLVVRDLEVYIYLYVYIYIYIHIYI